MLNNPPFYKSFLAIYLLKFLGSFVLLYYGTKAMIGLGTAGGYYIPFIHNYLDYISVFRAFLLYSSKGFLGLLGYPSAVVNSFSLQLINGRSVHLVYSCLGYGIISFWIAFVFANRGNFKKKAIWMFTGILVICSINILRICLLLLSLNKNWRFPLGLDHHTWFNIASYAVIFAGIYLYDRAATKHLLTTDGA